MFRLTNTSDAIIRLRGFAIGPGRSAYYEDEHKPTVSDQRLALKHFPNQEPPDVQEAIRIQARKPKRRPPPVDDQLEPPEPPELAIL